MKKIDKLGVVFNFILGVIYVPLSFFSWILQMASESTIDATNPLYITLINIFCIVLFIVPLLCVVGIVMSVILRKKGYSVLSFVIQFIPLVLFIFNLLFCFLYIDSIPAKL